MKMCDTASTTWSNRIQLLCSKYAICYFFSNSGFSIQAFGQPFCQAQVFFLTLTFVLFDVIPRNCAFYILLCQYISLLASIFNKSAHKPDHNKVFFSTGCFQHGSGLSISFSTYSCHLSSHWPRPL